MRSTLQSAEFTSISQGRFARNIGLFFFFFSPPGWEGLLLQGVTCKTPLAAAPGEVYPVLVMNTVQKQPEKSSWVQPGGLQLQSC